MAKRRTNLVEFVRQPRAEAIRMTTGAESLIVSSDHKTAKEQFGLGSPTRDVLTYLPSDKKKTVYIESIEFEDENSQKGQAKLVDSNGKPLDKLKTLKIELTEK